MELLLLITITITVRGVLHTPGLVLYECENKQDEFQTTGLKTGECNGCDVLNNQGVCNTPSGRRQTLSGQLFGGINLVTKQMNILDSSTYNRSSMVWQLNYHEHIIWNEKSYQNIADYIVNNPSKWNANKFHKK